MRIAVIPERYGSVLSPCASIRIAPFFGALGSDGMTVRFLLQQELPKFAPDIVVWHRTSLATEREVEALAALAQRAGARLIYDVDDNLLDIELHGEAQAYRTMVQAVALSLQVADQVWCSTPRLADRVAGLSRHRPREFPNVLDPTLWGEGRAYGPTGSRRLSLLYMGTRTHDEDCRFLFEGIRASRAGARGDIALSTIGVNALAVESPSWQSELAIPAHVGASYPAFVHWYRSLQGYDAGVAPLLSGPFNDCKSSIKVLDYAAIGLPSVVSYMPAYADSLAPSDALFVHNTVDRWAAALDELAESRSALPGCHAGARRHLGREAFRRGLQARTQALRSTFQ